METRTIIYISVGSTLFVVCLTAVSLFALRVWVKFTTGWCTSNTCLVGKTAIVTGANTGIGYETAADFAKRGAKVFLACRDPSRGKSAEAKIIEATDNKNVFFKELDLSSFKSIRRFAEDINKSEDRLDILVNSAGAGYLEDAKSEDGLLLVMQTNYFGHFLLTNLLLDLMKKTPNARIVNVASIGASQAKYFDVNKLNSWPSWGFTKNLAVYARSKLCNVLFTIELAERLKGTHVTAYSLHPGAVATEIFRRMKNGLFRLLFEGSIKCFFKNSVEGAQTSIYCSVQKGIEHLSGQHFHDCHVVDRYKTARDPNLPKQLWEVSEKLVHLT